MIKARVIVPFYIAASTKEKDSFIYLDEGRFKELKEKGKVEEADKIVETAKLKDGKKIIKKEK